MESQFQECERGKSVNCKSQCGVTNVSPVTSTGIHDKEQCVLSTGTVYIGQEIIISLLLQMTAVLVTFPVVVIKVPNKGSLRKKRLPFAPS